MKVNNISGIGHNYLWDITNELIANNCINRNFNVVDVKKSFIDYWNNRYLDSLSINDLFLNNVVDIIDVDFLSSFFQIILLAESKKLKFSIKK